MIDDMDAIKAVTAPDPYPYYADLVANAPLQRDEQLGMWVAASAEAVGAILTSELCRVRPPAELVPAALVGTAAGEVFGRLVRMIDGRAHAALKPAVASAIGDLDVGRLMSHASSAARSLAAEMAPVSSPEGVGDFALRVPVHVVAGLLGVADAELAQAASWTQHFAAALAPGAASDVIARGSDAVGRLREMFRARMREGLAGDHGRLRTLADAARRSGIDDDGVVANAIGLLFQPHEATAALIANAVARLATDAALYRRAKGDQATLRAVVHEVVRWDASVQNTRRFVAKSGIIAGAQMKEGEAILVVLAAANRDPAVNADPHRFDVGRASRVAFTFGAGPHACPGEAIAVAIATAGVGALLDSGLDPARLGPPVGYRRSANVRMALWSRSWVG
jgi:cytochrome P450